MKIGNSTSEEFARKVLETLGMGSNPQVTVEAAIELAFHEGCQAMVTTMLEARNNRLEQMAAQARGFRQDERKARVQ